MLGGIRFCGNKSQYLILSLKNSCSIHVGRKLVYMTWYSNEVLVLGKMLSTVLVLPLVCPVLRSSLPLLDPLG